MRRLALCALASVFALGIAGSAGTAKGGYGLTFMRLPHGAVYPISASDLRLVNAGFPKPRPVGPFVPNGGFVSLGADDSIDMGDGQIIGCVPGRLYAQAVDVRNRSKSAVILLGATGQPETPLRDIHHIATQVRLEPRPRSMGGGVTYIRHWSAAPKRPVTIPAGRSAIVQSNFRMAHCGDLAGGRTIVLPGEVFLKYDMGGTTAIEPVTVPDSRIVLMEGAAEHGCARVPGALSNIVAANMSCRVARKAAVACGRLWDGGTCKSDGTLWDCVAGESCWLPRNTSNWFTVVWRDS